KKLLDLGLHSQQPHFGLDGKSELAKLFQGPSPMNDGTTLSVPDAPEGFPVPEARERFEEFSPGLDPALLELVQATAELELS
ncbi:MAG TPA: manganese catalase family protein, partial [Actinomycetota bacterium]|nr:manganese catalase family protein [Actinomycetota bacterium]